MESDLGLQTPFHDRHVALGARMVDFAGWDMPVQYAGGIVEEHLATRKRAGLFDVSHMGRFIIRGAGSLPFLQHVLTNNARALDVGEAQYTIVPTPTGGAVDDAYLYRFLPDEYLLVVNASNREKDWDHFQQLVERVRAAGADRPQPRARDARPAGTQSRRIVTGCWRRASCPSRCATS